MKTILIATDFSNASRNACLYGLQLAKGLDADIYLFYAYKIPVPAAGLNVDISGYDLMVQTKDVLEYEAARFNYLNMKPMKLLCDEGAAEDAIINAAKEKKVDFIIVGMKGSGKSFKKLFGSTTTALAKKTSIPVIVVPENAKYKRPGNIVFATDAAINSEEDVPGNVFGISHLFKSKLYVVKVINKENEAALQTLELLKHKEKVGCTFDTSYEFPVDSNISNALNNFIEEHHCDMLVMTPHKHEWAELLFKKSETKHMIFHSRIPLLILPENALNSLNPGKINSAPEVAA